MNAFEIISLALNIGLGLVSLILGIFVVWLSLRFNDASNAALDAVKDLAREIKTLVQISLSQQTDFSTKMLDSIIEQNRFGRPETIPAQTTPSSLETFIRSSLENAERSITASVERKVRELVKEGSSDPQSVEAGIETIRSDIRKFSEGVQEGTSVREALRRFQALPAHYVLLAAITRSQAKSIGDIEKAVQKYHVPNDGWEGGLDNLIESGLVRENLSEFEVPPEKLPVITAWVDQNWPILSKLMAEYKNKSDVQVTEREDEIAHELEF